ncbi:hypothetical protein [Parasitella parasitica]|uniref:protein-tyrosine-phosphatase n=1 Tax=Parasitella parasitica TaxID=35722 RepID=A0A0B7NKM7_9FUNG|nr:hypothetical protein [Parasitella parasitica]
MRKRNLKKLALNLSPSSNSGSAQQPATGMLDSHNSAKEMGMQESTSNIYKQGPACILPNLYLGACYNACDATQLIRHGITCIINVASEIKINVPLPHIDYHHIKWTHSQGNLAAQEFDRAIETIRSAHKHRHTVLIHCQQGIERSAALILAFFLKSTHCKQRIDATITMNNDIFAGQNWSLDRALDFVKQKAPSIRPNMELLYQLREYEQSISTQLHLVEKRHNIQNRTRRSKTIACSKPSTRRALLTSSTLPSVHKVAYEQRPRSASLRDTLSSPFSTTKSISMPKSEDKQRLATAALIFVLFSMYQRESLSSTHNCSATIGTHIIPSNNSNSNNSKGKASAKQFNPQFLEHVYSMYKANEPYIN